MISTQKHRGQSRRELSRLSILKKRMSKLADELSLDSSELISFLDNRIEKLSKQITEYDLV